MIKKILLLTLIMFVLDFPGAAFSQQNDEIEKRINELEIRQAELYHSLKEKKAPGVMENISENLRLGGIIEIEANLDNNDNGDTTDIVLATASLGLDAKINDFINGYILLLYEDDGASEFTVDEGTITIAAPYGVVLTAGKMYVPFGAYHSHFISDPITLEIGETNESAFLFGYGTKRYEVSIAFFNGDVGETGDDDKIDDIVASITLRPVNGVTIGASYISDLADSDADITGVGNGGTISDVVSGYSGHINIEVGKVHLEGEYLAASDNYIASDISSSTSMSGTKPEAFNLEAMWQVNNAWSIAIKYEGNDDFGGPQGFPEKQYGADFSYGLYENTIIDIEYLHGEYVDNLKRDMVNARLAVEF